MKLIKKHAILFQNQFIFRILFSMLFIVLFFGCNSESASDCFQNAGKVMKEVVDVPAFTKITVFENVNMVLKEGATHKVEIETGEFLRNEVTAEVKDNRLLLRDTNNCNYVRDYGVTTIYVTAPNITEIRSSTGLLISSDGILTYPNLTLISESFLNPESETTDGAFDLEIASESLNIIVNGITYIKLNGTTTNFNVQIAAGDSRIEAEKLIAQMVTIDHRGTNNLYVNPQQSLKGVIRGTGDVISSKQPLEVAVQELFNGRLIFVD